jgi:hypothetical protein
LQLAQFVNHNGQAARGLDSAQECGLIGGRPPPRQLRLDGQEPATREDAEVDPPGALTLLTLLAR